MSQKHPKSLPDWAKPAVLHRNTIPPRANFHIFNSEDDALSKDITKARTCCLSGNEWKFHLASSPFEAPGGFEASSFDSSGWGDLQVPSMWQLSDFAKKGPHYTNVAFPFFVDPPNPPYNDNETGSYIKKFGVPNELKHDQLRLRFEGVDCAFHVWVNGNEVGFSQGSRNPHEFDITAHVHDGENTLAVRVYQYAWSSYIEDQDQWRMSGVFRDVYLLGFPKAGGFEDFDVKTNLDNVYENATLEVRADVYQKGTVQLQLLDADKNIVAKESKDSTTADRETVGFSINLQSPQKWTAETPYLYDLVLSFGEIYISQRVGFRSVELSDGVIKVNGKRIILRGANRHEHHPTMGRSVPYEFMKKDLILMKKHNLNAIRTCHQPSDIRLYDLADEMGFFVMDEADMECHGFETIADAALTPEQAKLPFFERQQLTKKASARWTTDNPDWEAAYLDRAEHLVRRDLNHPCVIIWSLGNEAFFGRNFVSMYNWIKKYDPTRLIHYEPDIQAETMDMHSRMYPKLDVLTTFAGEHRSGAKTKPLVLCEYIHAMGTGPGNIKEYIELFHKEPSLQGGFVWEWANHGLLTKTKEGIPYYGYGGDFGDVPNDYNFVMDGMLNSKHKPTSGLAEYKKALEPIKVVETQVEKAVFSNRYDFATLDHLECKYSLVDEKGPKNVTGDINMPKGVKPGDKATLVLPEHIRGSNNSENFLHLSFRLKNETSWAKAGHEVAFYQVPLTPKSTIARQNYNPGQLQYEQSGRDLIITSPRNISTWTFSITRCRLTSWVKIGGQEMITQPPEPTFYRAPTDNDDGLGPLADGKDWRSKLLPLAKDHVTGVSWTPLKASSKTEEDEEETELAIEVRSSFAPPTLSWSLSLLTTYTFTKFGTVHIKIHGIPKGQNLPKTIPRIGITLGLPKDFQTLHWYGRGPGESYIDMKESQAINIHYVTQIADLWTSPDFPQECSNRTDTRWLRVSSNNNFLNVDFTNEASGDEREFFDFMACHYDVGDIDKAQHPLELEEGKREDVVLRLDKGHQGLGSASCGPRVLEEYELKTGEFEFGVLLR